MKKLKNRNLIRMLRALRAVGCGIGLALAFSVTSGAAVICSGPPVSSTVIATNSAIAEAGAASAQFIFRLGGPVGDVTHLTLQISGTASNGVDYQTLPTQVTIPASQTQATLTVTPIPDLIAEGTETLTVRITASDNACVSIGNPDNATISIVEGNGSLATALDDPNLVWITGGNAVWSGLSSITHDGVDAAQSGFIADNQESWLQTSVNGPGTLTFWWKVSSEADFDWLRFHIDGILQQQISGEVDWQQRSFPLAQGSHTLKWRYVKDPSSPGGQDRAWLDQVSFTSASGAPVIVTQPASQIAWAGANVTLNAVALGAPTLVQQWFFNATNVIPDATNASLVLNNILSAQGGQYRFVVSNASGSVTSSIATVTVTTNGPVSQVLLFSDSLVASPFEPALTNLGQTFLRYSNETVFNSAVNGANRASTLVVVDAPQAVYAFSSLASFVSGGGRVLIQAYSLVASPSLAATFQVAIESRSSVPLPLYDWGGSPLFVGLSSPVNFIEIALGEDAQKLHPLAEARAVAGFVNGPTSGEAAVVIGNGGRTIVNGFYVEGASSGTNAIRLAQNEISFLIGAALGPPAILIQPPDRFAAIGATATFGVTVVGSRPITLQWRKNGQPISGATGTNYTITGVQSNHFGTYDAVVNNSLGSVTSRLARLDFGILPAVRQAPLSQSIVAGGSVTFSIEITGDPAPFTYEWRKFSPAPLLTNRFESADRVSFFTLSNVQDALAGTYRVIVRNPANTNGIVFTFSLTVLADSDGDGISDLWEAQHGFATNDPTDAVLDTDGDGLNNLGEYIAGTDPTNSMSVLKLERIMTGLTTTLEFSAVSNKTYTIQCADVLPAAPWTKVVDVIARGTNRLEVITNLTTGPQRYYRLITPRQP